MTGTGGAITVCPAHWSRTLATNFPGCSFIVVVSLADSYNYRLREDGSRVSTGQWRRPASRTNTRKRGLTWYQKMGGSGGAIWTTAAMM